MKLGRRLYDELIRHARAEAPLEACGILTGREGKARRFHPCRNVEASPVRYRIDPLDILRVLQDAEARGDTLVAIFHSHPKTEAYPSETDRRLAFYPDAVYLILSLAGPEPRLRGFRIQDGWVAEEPIHLEDEPA